MRTWVLGAADPEMAEIERVLLDAGQDVVYATRGGRRVRPSEAYDADRLIVPAGDEVVLVECDLVAGKRAIRVDHHRPGDPGYGAAPPLYLEASSLGQVLAILELPPTDEQLLVAAADHCLAAAYRGECPGVDPDELMLWRVTSRAEFQRRKPEDVLADVMAAQALLLRAPRLCLAPGVYVKNMCRSTPVPELPEAAARLGVGYVSGPLIDPDGRKKYTCSGSPEQVKAFLDRAELDGLVNVYGDPARGFAGGYR
jgi:hypothetical protein